MNINVDHAMASLLWWLSWPQLQSNGSCMIF